VLTAGVQELRFGSANATAAPSKDKALKLAKLNKELARSNSALKAEVASLKQDRSRLRYPNAHGHIAAVPAEHCGATKMKTGFRV